MVAPSYDALNFFSARKLGKTRKGNATMINHSSKTDTYTLPGIIVQTIHVSYDNWGPCSHTPQLFSGNMYPPYQVFQEII